MNAASMSYERPAGPVAGGQDETPISGKYPC